SPLSESVFSFTQQLALEALAEHSTPITVKDWFQEYQEKEPLPTLGDVMFYALLLPLTRSDKPLFSIDSLQKNWWEQQVCITEHTQACLEG
ncbi:hypothetical protein HKB16_03115, partial [Vibrio parahaemolyticus]|nr:hypothetical protein [Vibrio parahaemolyticus]